MRGVLVYAVPSVQASVVAALNMVGRWIREVYYIQMSDGYGGRFAAGGGGYSEFWSIGDGAG